MIYLALVLYSLLTLCACIPAGKILANYPETKSAWLFVAVVCIWPILAIVGAVAVAFSPTLREFARRHANID
jgi:hypothetical protein